MDSLNKVTLLDKIGELAGLTIDKQTVMLYRFHVVDQIICLDEIYKGIKHLEQTQEVWLSLLN